MLRHFVGGDSAQLGVDRLKLCLQLLLLPENRFPGAIEAVTVSAGTPQGGKGGLLLLPDRGGYVLGTRRRQYSAQDTRFSHCCLGRRAVARRCGLNNFRLGPKQHLRFPVRLIDLLVLLMKKRALPRGLPKQQFNVSS